MAASPLARVRKICLKLADTEERLSWGTETWRTTGRDGRIFAMFAHAETHAGEGTNAVWLKCTPTNQEFILRDNPRRCFKPPYVGPSGWIGVYLDGRVNWTQLASLTEDAYALALPKKTNARGYGQRGRGRKKALKQHGA